MAEADKKKNAFDLDKLINRRRRPGLNEACEVYEVDVSDAGPVSEDILNYDDVDDPDAYVEIPSGQSVQRSQPAAQTGGSACQRSPYALSHRGFFDRLRAGLLRPSPSSTKKERKQ